MINGTTELLAVIGNPIKHSASPKMHNAMIQSLGLDIAYVALRIEDNQFEAAIRGLKALNFIGFNVTVPYKETILPYLDFQDELSKSIGAVNTVVISEGKLKGYNTDGLGFKFALEKQASFSLANKKVVIIGAGGTAKAIAFISLHSGASSVHIVNRSADRVEELCELLSKFAKEGQLHYSLSKDVSSLNGLNEADIVVNTTPMGMAPYEQCFPIDNLTWIHDQHLIYDVVYSPKQTLFLQEAKKKNAKILNGAGMLAAQATVAFKLFTGKEASFDLMFEQIYG